MFVPVYFIFGSEELSSLSDAIKKRIPEPSIALSPGDAARLELGKGDKIEFESNGQKYNMKVKILLDLPDGVAGYPFGFKDVPYNELNGWFKLNGVKG